MAAKDAGPPDSSPDRLGFLLAYHGGITETLIRRALGLAGLTPRHAMTLMRLADGPVTQKALTEVLQVDPSVLVSLLNDLEGDDLARRHRDPADRRRHIVEITPEGADRLKKADAALDTVEGELFADLSERERGTLRKALGKLRTSPDDFTCTGDEGE
ncbi:MarR family winged helix-turn-helix transcriptional regulator [Streptomyces sp. NPDC060011]|nr:MULTISPECIES: MarR family transcriptional regulator [unclassified Streptomyces]MCX5134159.1 MarR family transcriptional regulator [Streptomyces sp. NBC_00340]MCX5281694.1 MarR family transcriptional regulator [Streptomyces sp. NBC_00198]WSD75136.1 MarR family transcriptional regulator [Streptomyces sp. NBC_01558]